MAYRLFSLRVRPPGNVAQASPPLSGSVPAPGHAPAGCPRHRGRDARATAAGRPLRFSRIPLEPLHPLQHPVSNV